MSGPKRNPDKLNTIGIVVVGVCSAVLVYVAIVALQAFYVNDTSEIQTMADYGGQDTTAKGHKADELRNITEPASNPVAPGGPQTYRISIDTAIGKVVDDAKKDPSHLVPALPSATKPTIQPIFGRPKPLGAPPPGESSGSGAAPAAPAGASTGSGGAGSGAATGSGSAAEPAAGSGASAGSGGSAAAPPASPNKAPAHRGAGAGSGARHGH